MFVGQTDVGQAAAWSHISFARFSVSWTFQNSLPSDSGGGWMEERFLGGGGGGGRSRSQEQSRAVVPGTNWGFTPSSISVLPQSSGSCLEQAGGQVA